MNRKSQVQSNATKNGKPKILVLHKGQIYTVRKLEETYMTKHMGETMCFVGISNAVMGRIYERYTHNRRAYM